ncbi:MAG: hypothetical protein KJZ85_04135 [Rhodobacteraceae bacterium]|jgi:hypothetical protein|nr:hypothetical protein [Paracoccaceae bacterium]
MRADRKAWLGAGIVALGLLPPVADLLQARLPTHVLVLLPLLAGGGAVAGAALARGRPAGWTAAPSLLAGAATLGFWLIPRWIDAALAAPAVAAVRTASLVFLAGLPLGWGWAQAGPVLRLFVLANAAAMLAVMGWIELVVPARLCNSYLLADQRNLGLGLLVLAGVVVAGAALRALAGGDQADATERATRRASPRMASPQEPSATNTITAGIGSRKP